MAYTCNPSTPKAKLDYIGIQGKPGIHRKTVSTAGWSGRLRWLLGTDMERHYQWEPTCQHRVSPFLRVGTYCGAPVSISWKPQPTVHTGARLAVKTSFLIRHHHPVTSFQNGFLRNMNYAEDCKRKCARQAFSQKVSTSQWDNQERRHWTLQAFNFEGSF